MARVLIGFGEALAAPEAYFSLRAAGHDVRVFTRKGRQPPSLIRRLPVGEPILLPAPEDNAEAATEALACAVEAIDAEVLLPLDDTSLALVAGAAPLAAVAGATGPQADIALDKERQTALAAESGFELLPTVVARSRAEVETALHDRIPFPAIAKPARAVQPWKSGLRKGEAHFLETPADVAALPANVCLPLLVQPLRMGTGEGIFGFATQSGVTAWSAHRRLRMMNPHGSGSSACVSMAPGPELRKAAQRFVEIAEWRGPFMIELLRLDDGAAAFMEFNGRLRGSTALARRSGLEYPAWAVGQALDPAFAPDSPAVQAGLRVRHLARDLLRVAFVLRGPRTDFHRRTWPGAWGAIAAALSPGERVEFYDYDPAHPRFFLQEAWDMLRDRAGRRG